MNSTVRCLVMICAFIAATPPIARSTPLQFDVITAQSSVNVELCLQGSCDSDPSSVSGFASGKTLPIGGPNSLTLYDFIFQLNDQIDLFISFGIFGSFTGTGQNVVLVYPTPGLPQPSTPITAGSYFYPAVPTNETGTFNYNATGLVCSLLQGQVPPIPCTDTINLADQGTQNGDIGGTVGVTLDRTVTLVMQPNVNVPLDPTNPGVGSLSVTGTIVARATAPLRGDVDLNGLVDGRDVDEFTKVLLNPAAFVWQKQFATDMNDDDLFDDADVSSLVTCLLGGGCPD